VPKGVCTAGGGGGTLSLCVPQGAIAEEIVLFKFTLTSPCSWLDLSD
jgi:hypothetical protein